MFKNGFIACIRLVMETLILMVFLELQIKFQRYAYMYLTSVYIHWYLIERQRKLLEFAKYMIHQNKIY